MEIHFTNECRLSKTQKKKLRNTIKETWTGDEDAFRDATERILESIYYDEKETEKYNVLKFDYCEPLNRMEIILDHVKMETPEERREMLRKKLHAKLKDSKRPQAYTDPKWEAYEQMRSRLPLQNRGMIPSPTQVLANEEMYRNMMTMIPNQNPLHKYLSLFFPS